jgi:hypothetical protein
MKRSQSAFQHEALSAYRFGGLPLAAGDRFLRGGEALADGDRALGLPRSSLPRALVSGSLSLDELLLGLGLRLRRSFSLSLRSSRRLSLLSPLRRPRPASLSLSLDELLLLDDELLGLRLRRSFFSLRPLSSSFRARLPSRSFRSSSRPRFESAFLSPPLSLLRWASRSWRSAWRRSYSSCYRQACNDESGHAEGKRAIAPILNYIKRLPKCTK